jgi:glutamate-ammonia-ligase adenylyltransferase
MKAMKRLLRRGLLSPEEDRLLSEAYIFLRDLENKLQMVDDQQTHILPADRNEVGACAMMLGYENRETLPAADQLLTDYRKHTGSVHQIFRKVFDQRS